MNRKYIVLFLFLILLCVSGIGQTPGKRPNVIFILADDLGYETLAVNGGESYSTPNLDKLAGEGMRFEHCYAQPQCTPSRVQLLTGIYNVRNYVNFGSLHKSQVTVAQLFRNAGYVTGATGKWQLGKEPDNPNFLGFDDYLLWQVAAARVDSVGWDPKQFPPLSGQAGGRDTRFSQPVLEGKRGVVKYKPEDYGPKAINDFALDFIEKNAKGEKPFFFFYSMMLTHCPFSPTPDSPAWLSDNGAVMSYKGDAKYFGDMVSYMDKMIGNINAKLEELGIDKNTLVIFTGDNGTDAPIVSKYKGRDVAGAKLGSIDAGTRVPLIASWPGTIKAGTKNSDLIDFTDFMPTMLEAGNITAPESLKMDGVSFLPQLKGKTGFPRRWVYSWFMKPNPAKKEPIVYVRNHKYKLYGSGEFVKIQPDYLPEQPLQIGSLSGKTKKIHQELQAVLTDKSKRRLDAINDIKK